MPAGKQQTVKAQAVLDGTQGSTGNWTRDHSFNILAQNFFTFYLCPNTLWEDEFEGEGLINLAGIFFQSRLAVFHQILSGTLKSTKENRKKFLK